MSFEGEGSMSKIPVGLVGYGNIGRGAELSVNNAPDMELVAVFTRRPPNTIKLVSKNVPVLPIEEAFNMKNEINTMVLCGGSATDLPIQSPMFAEHFNIVDSYDTHSKILDHIKKIDSVITNTVAVVSAGWDPGLFSIIRSMMSSVLPNASSNTFWGRGVSQGHSDAIRHIKGVKSAVQYTVPIAEAMELTRQGVKRILTPKEKHKRECYVVIEDGANKEEIENSIKTMPDYFADYETSVTFISEEELKKNHSLMPHAGAVIGSGLIGENRNLMEFSLELESNAAFTSSILVAYARAASRLASEGIYGAKTVFDIPLSYLSVKDREALIKELM